MIEQPRAEIEHRHQRRAPDGGAGGHDLRVRRQQEQRDERAAGRPLIPPSEQQPVDEAGEDGDVAAGNRDDVIRAGGLQPQPDVVRQPGPIADEHGGDDRGRDGVVRRDPSLRRCAGRERGSSAAASCDGAPALANIDEQRALDRSEEAVPASARSRSKSGTPSFR